MPRSELDGKSRNALDGKVVSLRKGLAIYKVLASPYWRCRIWLPSKKRNLVRTTKAETRVEAITAAEEMFASLGSKGQLEATPHEKTFEFFADRLLEIEQGKSKSGETHYKSWKNVISYLKTPGWGPIHFFGKKDVREIRAKHVYEMLDKIRIYNLSSSTVSKIIVYFRKVMRLAQREGLIEIIPDTVGPKKHQEPRAFFRFYPLVSKEEDEWKRLLECARRLQLEKRKVRGALITEELYDFIVFMAHSFIRPTESEAYALRHQNIEIVKDGKRATRLVLTIPKGKTGHRSCDTMDACVGVYERLCRRHQGYQKTDFVFLPQYTNRSYAKYVFQNQFREVLKEAKLENDLYSPNKRTVYSLRHQAIVMRLAKSQGKINIYFLAKNAGTSVQMIEKFYAKYLPNTEEVVRNLQTFGDA